MNTSRVDPRLYRGDLPTHFDSAAKQHCFDDLQAYHAHLHECLDALPAGHPNRLSLMAEINNTLAAMRSLVTASDEEVAQAHAQFLEAIARTGFALPVARNQQR